MYQKKVKYIVFISLFLFIVSAALLLYTPVTNIKSIKKIKKQPVFTMSYKGPYLLSYELFSWFVIKFFIPEIYEDAHVVNIDVPQSCTLFSTFSNNHNLLAKNRDIPYSTNGMIVFNKPKNGCSSISFVDLTEMGVYNPQNTDKINFANKIKLLLAPLMPTEGMNQYGLAIGPASAPKTTISEKTNKPTLILRTIVRVILDKAKTVDEAVVILNSYYVLFPVKTSGHLLIADKSGKSVIIEFKNGVPVVIPKKNPYQVLTNFTISNYGEKVNDLRFVCDQPSCRRYYIANSSLGEKKGNITKEEGFAILHKSSVPQTIWSVLFDLETLNTDVVFNRDFDNIFFISSDHWL